MRIYQLLELMLRVRKIGVQNSAIRNIQFSIPNTTVLVILLTNSTQPSSSPKIGRLRQGNLSTRAIFTFFGDLDIIDHQDNLSQPNSCYTACCKLECRRNDRWDQDKNSDRIEVLYLIVIFIIYCNNKNYHHCLKDIFWRYMCYLPLHILSME